MTAFKSSLATMEELLSKSKPVSEGKTLSEAGIDSSWMAAYGEIARRCRDDREFGLSRYPYEPASTVGAFTGGFFEHPGWPLRKAMEKHSSLRAIWEYECNYINSCEYWLAFHESAIALRQENLEKDAVQVAEKFDVWGLVAVRYGLRSIGLRTECYRMSAKDPAFARLVIPTLQRRGEMAAADDLVEPLDKLDSYVATQLMKAVATLSASNATKHSGNGSAADGQ